MRKHSPHFYFSIKHHAALVIAVLAAGFVGTHASAQTTPPLPGAGSISGKVTLVESINPYVLPAAKVGMPAPAAPQLLSSPSPAPVAAALPATPAGSNGLIGSIGYAKPYGNCVNEPGINNPRAGNPSGWPATSQTPWIGATALFTYNHVGVVTGIWSNGDVEIRHQNYYGGQHRFPRSAFRGFR